MGTEATIVHLPLDWGGCDDRPLAEGRHEELTDPGEVGDLTCPDCRDHATAHHLVTLTVRTAASLESITVPVPRTEGPGFQVNVDGAPIAGLLAGPDGYLWLGHWPTEDEWVDLAPTAYRDPDQEGARG